MRKTLKALGFFALGTVISSTAALAQSAGPDEAVRPNGSVTQNVTLTAAQKAAIFNAIFDQPVKPHGHQLTATVGAPVPQTADLVDLPDNAAAADPAQGGLKYGMAGNDIIVLVDPVLMRVVDVIHNNAKP